MKWISFSRRGLQRIWWRKNEETSILRGSRCSLPHLPRIPPTLSDAKIKFKGAECDLHYDIYLDPPNPDAHCTPVSPTQCMLLCSLSLSLIVSTLPFCLTRSLSLSLSLSINIVPRLLSATTGETRLLGIYNFYCIEEWGGIYTPCCKCVVEG